MSHLRHLTLLSILAVWLLGLPTQASEFTAAQRAEIVQILRDALKQDPSILREAVDALQADDGKNQRAALAAAKDSLVDPADPVNGNPNGDVTIVEFFDTRCPYCRKLEPSMAELLAHDHGVRLVYKDLPILGPASVLGSKALLAAQRQGGYENPWTAPASRWASWQTPPEHCRSGKPGRRNGFAGRASVCCSRES